MPTISTRKFLKLLHSALPAVPMWGLFADPAGVGIYPEYKHGSARSVSEGLALPNLQWLGLSLSDAARLVVLQRSNLRLTAKEHTPHQPSAGGSGAARSRYQVNQPDGE